MSELTLPKSWTTIKLREIDTWRGGGTPSKSNPAFWTNGAIPWVSPKDMKQPRLSTAQDLITEAAVESSATNLVPAGSVLLVTRSGILAHSLPVAVNLVPVALNQDIKALTPHDITDAEYLRLVFQCFERDILNTCRKGGTTVHSIEFPALQEFTIPLPPLAEQKRIVAKIEELFSELDAGEESLRAARRQLGVYRQSLLKQAFEGKLTETWRTQREQQTGWRTVALESISEDISYGYTASSTQEKVGPHLLRITDIQDNRVNWDEVPYCPIEPDRKEHYLLKAGDLVFARTGATVGKSFLIKDAPPESVFASYLIRVRCQPGNSMGYLAMFFQSPSYWSQITEFSSGIGQPNVNGSKLKKLQVPLCSLPEQQEIVRLLDQQFEAIERNEREIDAALKRSEALRQAILKKAFTGQLVPQDPADEPASTLLARIRAESAAAAPSSKVRRTRSA